MDKQNLDWKNLGFTYYKTDKRYVSKWKNNVWDKGALLDDENVYLNESAGILQYCQQVFEGLKAYTWEDGAVVCFRPDLNAERIIDSAKRIQMPPFPKERFLSAVDDVVKANLAWVPPYNTGASLYLRPYEYASGIVIGVSPADKYEFRIFATPVGPYYKGGATPVSLVVSDFDRAAPCGTGAVKAGLNYAMSLHSSYLAHKNGFAENLYLDPKERRFVEETGGSNIIFIDKKNTLVIPKSSSILPSITRRSVVYVAEHYLNLKVEERPVEFSEVKEFKECGLCGTAAVISPVGKIVNGVEEINFPSGMTYAGDTITALYKTLTGIQNGKIKAPDGWIRKIV